jgi:predicted alpha/beta superfamily hydrolase
MKAQIFIRFLLPIVVIVSCSAGTKKLPGDIVLPYPAAKDSFLIRINDMAQKAEKRDTVHIVYYADGSLKSGKQMQELIAQHSTELTKNKYVFVGVAHYGFFRPKRRRDFIAPSVKTVNGYEGVSEDYGQADQFYSFLKNEIIPLAEKKYAGYIISRSFIGHSLGGLFATYLFISGDQLFDNVYALSPSLWIDNYHLLNYESSHQDKLRGLKKNVWISCGSAEGINRIKAGVEKIQDTLAIRKYPGINYTIKMYEGESHNSSVAPTLKDIFQKFTN